MRIEIESLKSQLQQLHAECREHQLASEKADALAAQYEHEANELKSTENQLEKTCEKLKYDIEVSRETCEKLLAEKEEVIEELRLVKEDLKSLGQGSWGKLCKSHER